MLTSNVSETLFPFFSNFSDFAPSWARTVSYKNKQWVGEYRYFKSKIINIWRKNHEMVIFSDEDANCLWQFRGQPSI